MSIGSKLINKIFNRPSPLPARNTLLPLITAPNLPAENYDTGTILVRNPNVEDYFKIIPTLSSLEEYYQIYGDDIARWYEEGKVIIFDKIPITYNAELLHRVKFPMDRMFQKLKDNDLLKPIENNFAKAGAHALNLVFGKDRELAIEFQAEIHSVNAQMKKFAELLFPQYVFNQTENITWRFSPTYAEGIHLDSFNKRYTKAQQLRMFINMDFMPRIWNSSHRLNTLIDNYFAKFGSDLNIDEPEEFNKVFSKRIFGSVKHACRDKMPKHTAMFAPGTLWMVNSLLVPHQIFFGRRMVSGSFYADMRSMLDPAKSFYNIVTNLRSRKNKEAA